MIEKLLHYIEISNPITLGVLVILSIYLFIILWIFLFRWFVLNDWLAKETQSLESLLLGSHSIGNESFLKSFLQTTTSVNKDILDLAYLVATKDSTKGVTFLAVVASTSPFIGLFGTVVSILDTFQNIGHARGTMTIIATGVSDALVATAAGIFVAIFAYTFHQIIKRKAFELTNLIKMQSDALLSKGQV